MNSQSTALSPSQDGPIGLVSLYRELQAKVHNLTTKFKSDYQIDALQPSAKGASLVDEFNKAIWPVLVPDYECLVNELVFYCRDELLGIGLRCMVYGRTKTAQSVKRSLQRRENGRKSPFTDLRDIFYEMHDLAGIMVVVQSENNLGPVNEFISQKFQAIKEPNHWQSDRPVGKYWDARFGSYESHNHHVALKEDSEYSPVTFEIQVTTFKDFIYNQYAHPWFYKENNGPLTEKDEIVMDMMRGFSYLIEMGGEYFLIREKENRERVEVEHGLFKTKNAKNDKGKSKSSRRSPNLRAGSDTARRAELSILATEKLLKMFQYDRTMIIEDCNNILSLLNRSGHHTEEIDEERVLAIQSHPQLRTWISLDQSSMMLLDGRGNPGPRCETSLISAKISSALIKLHHNQDKRSMSRIAIPLIFHCGEHRDFLRDPSGNAAELALSLLLQLVDRGSGFFEYESLRKLLQTTNPEDIETIYESLRRLIMELPEHVYLIMIIDGLRFFAKPAERRQETDEFVANLVALFRQGSSATLKFLFTGASRHNSFEGLFENDEIIRLSRDLPESGPVNDLAWRRPLLL